MKRFAAAIAIFMLFLAGGCSTRPKQELVAVQRQLDGVMSTDFTLIAVVPAGKKDEADAAFDEIAVTLSTIETKMSSHRSDSELTRLNTAPVGQAVPLSTVTMEVLRRAREFTPATHGAFDVTCRPILEMWRKAGIEHALPSDKAIAEAVANTGWRHFQLGLMTATRLDAGASIDLGGIGKKYAIDRAVEIMVRHGCTGGLVNGGGDVRCFGTREDGGPWRIGVRNPFGGDANDIVATVAVEGVAVCSSGNYERFVEIHGRRYSHIADPRTGLTCDGAPSVTVIGKDATTAGLWGTALSVLGVDGIAMMPRDAGLEVIMAVGNSEGNCRWYRTRGVEKMIVGATRVSFEVVPSGH